MNVYIVFSKETGHIMAVYSNYDIANRLWPEPKYAITEYPVLSN